MYIKYVYDSPFNGVKMWIIRSYKGVSKGGLITMRISQGQGLVELFWTGWLTDWAAVHDGWEEHESVWQDVSPLIRKPWNAKIRGKDDAMMLGVCWVELVSRIRKPKIKFHLQTNNCSNCSRGSLCSSCEIVKITVIVMVGIKLPLTSFYCSVAGICYLIFIQPTISGAFSSRTPPSSILQSTPCRGCGFRVR